MICVHISTVFELIGSQRYLHYSANVNNVVEEMPNKTSLHFISGTYRKNVFQILLKYSVYFLVCLEEGRKAVGWREVWKL